MADTSRLKRIDWKPLAKILAHKKVVRESDSMKAGAFGNWKKLNVKKDVAITEQKSEKGVSCVSAVGEMLMKSRNASVKS